MADQHQPSRHCDTVWYKVLLRCAMYITAMAANPLAVNRVAAEGINMGHAQKQTKASDTLSQHLLPLLLLLLC